MARIMVVEDEPITAADLELKLTALGHQVTACPDTGEEALAQAKTLPPDLVLMDIRLRGEMSGIEVAQHLREERDVPIVFLTAFADQDTVDRACDTQPYGYLLKPFTERAVATAVQVALARAHAEQANVDRERWVSAALRSAGEGLVAVDENATIRFVNEPAERLLKLKAHELLGKDARALLRFGDGDAAAATHPLDAALREGRVTSSTSRELFPMGGGARVLVCCSAAPVLASQGGKAGAILVFREVSPAQEEPGPARLAALNELSRRLSHEINNPLTYNLGAVQLALRELERLRAVSAVGAGAGDPSGLEREKQLSRVEEFLRNAEEGATRIAGVIRELGSFSLAERDLTPLDPVELLDLAIGLSRVEAAKHVQLLRHLDSVPLVRGNKWQLSAVLAYALASAVGTLDPSRAAANTLTLDVGTDGRGWAAIRVTAAGRRLPAPLPRTEPRGDNVLCPTTVGLAVAEQVVGSHGGELVLRDRPDGRVVELYLPPIDVGAAPPVGSARSETAPRRSSVLVIDDEPMIGRVLEITLQTEHDVTSVQSAESALGLLERGDAFDVILCDLSMPSMSGQDFYEHLRATRPDLAARVVFMTGGVSSERAARFIDEMAGRCIEKPFSTRRLLGLLAECVRARSRHAVRAQC